MHLVKTVALLSFLVVGCGLLKSEPGSSGANAPIMYGTGPAAPGAGGSGATPFDADVPPLDRADGSDPGDGASDTSSLAPDTASHADGQLWIRFPPSSYVLTQCTWLSKDEGYCRDAPTMLLGTVWVYLYKTTNGGKSWSLVCPIDTGMDDLQASIEVYVMSRDDIWFVAGSAHAGNVGHSFNGGKNWVSLTSEITALLTPATTGDAGVTSVPVWQLAAQGGRVWLLPQGPNLVYSPDGGVTWKKVTPPADFSTASKRSLLATQNNLFLQYMASDGSLGLYRWNGAAFLPIEASLPLSSAGNHAGTWFRAWPALEGLLFVDRGPLPDWQRPFWVYATTDGGKSVQKILPDATGSGDVLGLSDGVAFSAAGSITAYVGGIFTDGSGDRFLEIRQTQDAGKTWSTVHSEPSYPGDGSTISLSVDSAGNVHAMHALVSTDGIGPPVIYDAHYVLR